jgi:FAD/FMN-containing dehydrogenase
MPDGEIWHGLKRLRKDNTGYDLKQLLIGAEGTLGIVTGAVLKLFPRPAEKITALVGVASPGDAVALLSYAQNTTGGAATSFELMSRPCVELVAKHFPDIRDPLNDPHPWYVLMEFSSGSTDTLTSTIENLLSAALEKGLITDAIIAQSGAQSDMLWRMRHSIPFAGQHEGPGAHHDISVATSDIPAFLEKADEAAKSIVPDVHFITFGHIGDGNLHYNVYPPLGTAQDALVEFIPAIESAVYDVIEEFNGSISAEHGIGQHRRDSLAARKSPIELEMMRAIKNALDPDGIMNPGKML